MSSSLLMVPIFSTLHGYDIRQVIDLEDSRAIHYLAYLYYNGISGTKLGHFCRAPVHTLDQGM